MDEGPEPPGDFAAERRAALEAARAWGVELESPFAFSNVSFVAPTTSGTVLKVASLDDEESLHEADALEVWGGVGAVRLLRRSGRVLLEERAVPGDDLSGLAEDDATAIAVTVAQKLWRPASRPFRPVTPEVWRWLEQAGRDGSEVVPLARSLLREIGERAEWLVHGDFHHHNILRRGGDYVAIDPKPYLADREYDVASFLWNPFFKGLGDTAQVDRRIEMFVAAGLDEFRIRAWTVIRGSYLRPEPEDVGPLRALLARGDGAPRSP